MSVFVCMQDIIFCMYVYICLCCSLVGQDSVHDGEGPHECMSILYCNEETISSQGTLQVR